MRYLFLVSHAGLAEGVRSALEMLMGPREHLFVLGMGEKDTPESFGAQVSELFCDLEADDEVIVLGDIAGGSPLRAAVAALEEAGMAGRMAAFGGLNLPMAIGAIMAVEDEFALDAVCDGILANGADAVCRVA